jgi:hypothetical protein
MGGGREHDGETCPERARRHPVRVVVEEGFSQCLELRRAYHPREIALQKEQRGAGDRDECTVEAFGFVLTDVAREIIPKTSLA